MLEIGSFEAKTRLPELLRKAKWGARAHYEPPWVHGDTRTTYTRAT